MSRALTAATAALRRLNDETFRAEEKNRVVGMEWDAFLRSALADDFVLRRSREDVEDETRDDMIRRIARSDRPPARTVVPESVEVWASDTLGVVTCILTMPDDDGRERAYQNVKVFRAVSRGAWLCAYWQVTARPLPGVVHL